MESQHFIFFDFIAQWVVLLRAELEQHYNPLYARHTYSLTENQIICKGATSLNQAIIVTNLIYWFIYIYKEKKLGGLKNQRKLSTGCILCTLAIQLWLPLQKSKWGAALMLLLPNHWPQSPHCKRFTDLLLQKQQKASKRSSHVSSFHP